MLLSEAMHLGIPVYAIPLAVYEQQMNAHVIHKHGFGISHPRLEEKKLRFFIRNMPHFSRAILGDRTVLLREAGQERIIQFLEKMLR
jgi:UDP:flavonoid glycosyltransferase YjiC (YdhE family)